MAWTTPRTWVTNELVTAALLNTHLRDDLLYLFSDHPIAKVLRLSVADVTTSATSFTNMDGTNLKLEMEVLSGRATVMAIGQWAVTTTANTIYGDWLHENTTTRAGGTDGSTWQYQGGVNGNFPMVLVAHFTGLAVLTPGTKHVFKPQWKVSAGTGYLRGNNILLLGWAH